ncbi:MAG: type 2 isopentenyl-diphosphate Delta-isomerase [Propioniciclava sp.]|uniref:type 2 isopentenyl-diphosphate Delta-isomerase n=1 Tax=Propioniciclava sp. TaxID=2038686 RepID=UPI0039E3B7DE
MSQRDSDRKDEHVRISEELRGRQHNGFDDVRFLHHSFGELGCDGVDLGTTVTGRPWPVPFYINAMTGGSEMTGRINADLSRAAAATGVAMASGSVSVALRNPALAPTFRVIRQHAPEAFLFANVSPGVTPEQARHAVELLDADALQVHVNPAQELVMPEGDRDFRGWLDRIEAIVAAVPVPVVVKEVGFGLSAASIAQVAARGVRTVDVSGRGGTNFAAIENQRRAGRECGYLAGWGQSTVECLLDALHRLPADAGSSARPAGTAATTRASHSSLAPSSHHSDASSVHGAAPSTRPCVEVLASGGVRTPLDVVRALALGAGAVGVSGHFLHTLLEDGLDALIGELESWIDQVRALLTLLGAADVAALRNTDLLVTGATAEFAHLRGIDLQRLARRSEAADA